MYVCLLKESTSILKAAIKKNNKISNCAIFVTAMALFIERPMYIVAFFFVYLFVWFFFLSYIQQYISLVIFCLFIICCVYSLKFMLKRSWPCD